MKKITKRGRSNIIILIIVALFLLCCIKENSRNSTSQEKIKIEVLSNKINTKTVTRYGKFHDDIDYVYITFKYGDYIYNDFELGEKEDFPDLKNQDTITLVVHKNFRDNKEINEFINTHWYDGCEAKEVN